MIVRLTTHERDSPSPKIRMIIITMSRFTLTKKAMRRLEKQMLASSRLVVLSWTNININVKINIIVFILIIVILIFRP